MLSNPFFFISLGILAYLLLFLWPDHAICHYRDKLFKLRQKLFTDAAEGRYSFEDYEYKAARETINAQLRFAHVFDITMFWLGIFIANKKIMAGERHRPYLIEKNEEEMSAAEIEKIDELNSTIVRGTIYSAKLLFWRQPLLIPFYFLAFILFALWHGASQINLKTIGTKVGESLNSFEEAELQL